MARIVRVMAPALPAPSPNACNYRQQIFFCDDDYRSGRIQGTMKSSGQ